MRSRPEHPGTPTARERRGRLIREAGAAGNLVRAFDGEHVDPARPFDRGRKGGVASGVLPEGLKRGFVYLCLAAAVFLAGLVPMWRRARAGEEQAVAARRALRLSLLENRLAAAALYARRGEYESARRQASGFFKALRVQADAAEELGRSHGRRASLAPLLHERDDIITLLARSDPAAADRLTEMYEAFRNLSAHRREGENGSPPTTSAEDTADR